MSYDPDGRNPKTASTVHSAQLRLPLAYVYPEHPGFEEWAEDLLRSLGSMPMEQRSPAVIAALTAAYIEGQGFARVEAQ